MIMLCSCQPYQGFYATFVGKQRNEPYVDPARFPQA
jgi:hypothetical protein